jgi:hypothetical protein
MKLIEFGSTANLKKFDFIKQALELGTSDKRHVLHLPLQRETQSIERL